MDLSVTFWNSNSIGKGKPMSEIQIFFNFSGKKKKQFEAFTLSLHFKDRKEDRLPRNHGQASFPAENYKTFTLLSEEKTACESVCHTPEETYFKC